MGARPDPHPHARCPAVPPERFAARFDGGDDGSIERQSQDYQRLQREILAAQRQAVVDLRRQGRINDDVMNRIQRDFDLEDARLDI